MKRYLSDLQLGSRSPVLHPKIHHPCTRSPHAASTQWWPCLAADRCLFPRDVDLLTCLWGPLIALLSSPALHCGLHVPPFLPSLSPTSETTLHFCPSHFSSQALSLTNLSHDSFYPGIFFSKNSNRHRRSCSVLGNWAQSIAQSSFRVSSLQWGAVSFMYVVPSGVGTTCLLSPWQVRVYHQSFQAIR